MSKPVNPYTIGAFLVGSLVLLIAAVLIFGGGQFFKKKNEFVI
jgi:paraquat-inducible protein B